VVIHRAQSKLEPLGHAPGAIVGPHVDQPGGLLTGRLRGTLVAQLAHNMAVGIVAYNLLSDEAEYWEYIEFGHWVKNATPAWFWPGYHMLESSIAESIPAIRRSVKAAWEDTAIALAAEARTPTPGIHVGGTSPLLHR
jgi:hypothetical protein